MMYRHAFVPHPQLFHHMNRRAVFFQGHCDNSRKPDTVESIPHCNGGRLCCQTLAPLVLCQPPPDLHAREVIERLEPTKADQPTVSLQNELPEAIIEFLIVSPLAFDKFADFFLGPGLSVPDIAHHHRINSNGLESGPVGAFPRKKQKSFAFKSLGRHFRPSLYQPGADGAVSWAREWVRANPKCESSGVRVSPVPQSRG